MKLFKGEIRNYISNKIIGYRIYAKSEIFEIEYDDYDNDIIIHKIKDGDSISLKELSKLKPKLRKAHKEANREVENNEQR